MHETALKSAILKRAARRRADWINNKKSVYGNFRHEALGKLVSSIPQDAKRQLAPESYRMLDKFACDLADQLVKKMVEIRRQAMKVNRKIERKRETTLA